MRKRYKKKNVSEVTPTLRQQLQRLTIPQGIMRYGLDSPGFIVTCNIQGVGIVGWCIYNNRSEEFAIFVHKNYRQQGIGNNLIKRAQKELPQRTELFLRPFLKHIPACERLAEKLGNVNIVR